MENLLQSDNQPIILPKAQNLSEISENIQNGKVELKNNLEKTKDNKTYKLERHWFGPIKKSSIEKAITGVHSDSREFAGNCAKAICSLSDNIIQVLKALQLITMGTQDLYTRIHNQSVNTNKLRSLMNDWCNEYNINIENQEQWFQEQIKKLQETKLACESFVGESNNHYNIYQQVKREADIYKLISISAMLVSIVSLLYAIFT